MNFNTIYTDENELPRIWLTVLPRSLYTSLTTLIIKVKGESFSLKFNESYKVVDVEIRNGDLEFTSDGGQESILLFRRKKGIMKIRLLVDGAVRDVGWDLFPFTNAHFNLSFKLSPYRHASIRIVFPKGLRGYVRRSYIRCGTREYKFNGNYTLKHESKGLSEEQISYFCFDENISQEEINIQIETFYRLSSYRLVYLIFPPYIIGFFLLIIWGIPSWDLTLKIPLTGVAVPLIYYLWERAIAYTRDVICFLSVIYLIILIIIAIHIPITIILSFNYKAYFFQYYILFTLFYIGLFFHTNLLFLSFRYKPILDDKVGLTFRMFRRFRKIFYSFIENILIK